MKLNEIRLTESVDYKKMSTAQLRNLYRRQEAENRHSENAVMLAAVYGTPGEYKKTQAIFQKHMQRGHITPSEISQRNDISLKYYGKLMKEDSQVSETYGSNWPHGVDSVNDVAKLVKLNPAETNDLRKVVKGQMDLDKAKKLVYKLTDYFVNSGDMPMDVAKGRTEEPEEWLWREIEDLRP